MKRVRRGLMLAAVLAVAAGCDRGSHPDQIGKPAPQFAVNDGQQSANLAALRGHVVLLNFWATWCGPCVEELPALEQMQRDLPQVSVITISTDEDAEAYRTFLLKHRVSLLSVREGNNKANELYVSIRYPETYVIDKDGIIRRKFIGPQDWTSAEIENYLKKLAL
jgi:cytochrome c biogenesis protein CcmG, thiol:disulfide interchange protein DsbE